MIEIARTRAEVEGLAERWSGFSWSSERAEHAYFLAEVEQPLALLSPEAALVGRVDERPLESRLGYVTVYAPRLRVLSVVGVAGGAASLAYEALREVDVITVPALPVDSEEYRSLAALTHQRFVPSWERRLLVLPESFDAFLATRTKKVRSGVRYDAKRLEHALDVRVDVARAWSSGLLDELETIAGAAYQRRLGAGFKADRAASLQVALDHGWARVYVLRNGDAPVAFWLCGVHGEALRLNTTGYLPEYAAHRPGIYLLMRVIEDAIADPAIRIVDFGPGRSDYKRHFSNSSYEERNLILFASTVRARRVRYVRNTVAGTTLVARRLLDRIGGTQRVKTAWRRRLRR